jgi:TP901 family phage tail tape measure protein
MANKLVLKFEVDDKGVFTLKNIQNNIKKAEKNTDKLGRTLKRVFASTAMIYAMNGIRLAMAGLNKEVIEFNKTFKQVEGITNTSGKALKKLKDITIDISNSTEHSASAIAKSVLTISKMGFSLRESLEVIPHVADLATASITTMDNAAGVAVQTMKSFNLVASDVGHITNVIQGTVSSTAIGFDDFAESMKFIAPIASAMGESLEATSAKIGILGDVGIKGSLGGTTLKNMLLNIMKPSKKVYEALKSMSSEGLTFNRILKKLADEKIPIKDFLETFNKRAVAGSLALAKLNAKVERLTQNLINNKIKVSDVADTIRESWVDSLRTLSNTFNNVFVVMSDIIATSGLGVSLDDISQQFISLQNWLKKNPEITVNAARSFIKLAHSVIYLASKGFKFLIKNADIVLGVLKILTILKLSSIFLKWNNGLLKLVTGMRKAIKVFKIFNPIVLGTVTAFEVANLAVDRYTDSLERNQKVLANTSAEGLLNTIHALEMYKDSYADRILKLEKEKKSKLANPPVRGYTGEGADALIKRVKVERDYIAKRIGKIMNIDWKFFIGFDVHKIDSILAGLKKKRESLIPKEEKKEKKKEKEKFKLDLTSDLRSNKDMKELAESKVFAYIKYLEIIGNGESDAIARAFSGFTLKGAKLALPDEILAGIPSKDISNLGKLSSGFKENLDSGSPEVALSKFVIPGISDQTKDILDYSNALNIVNKDKKELNDIINKTIAISEKEIDAIQEVQDSKANIADIEKAIAEEHKAYIFEQAMTYASAAQMSVDIISMVEDARFEKRKAQIEAEISLADKKYNSEMKHIQDNNIKKQIVEKKYQKHKEKLLKEEDKLQSEYNKKKRRDAMITAGINTALGVTQALANVAPPASWVMAGISLAMGMAQMVTIANSDSYYDAGYTGDGDPRQTAGVVHKREFVIGHDDVDMIGKENIQDMIEQRVSFGSSKSRNININIDTFIGQEDYERGLFVRMEKEAQRW